MFVVGGMFERLRGRFGVRGGGGVIPSILVTIGMTKLNENK